jgi:hypothetical protein
LNAAPSRPHPHPHPRTALQSTRFVHQSHHIPQHAPTQLLSLDIVSLGELTHLHEQRASPLPARVARCPTTCRYVQTAAGTSTTLRIRVSVVSSGPMLAFAYDSDGFPVVVTRTIDPTTGAAMPPSIVHCNDAGCDAATTVPTVTLLPNVSGVNTTANSVPVAVVVVPAVGVGAQPTVNVLVQDLVESIMSTWSCNGWTCTSASTSTLAGVTPSSSTGFKVAQRAGTTTVAWGCAQPQLHCPQRGGCERALRLCLLVPHTVC